MPIPIFRQERANSAVRVPGTAVFMASTADGVPHALLHNIKHNKVLHERVILTCRCRRAGGRRMVAAATLRIWATGLLPPRAALRLPCRSRTCPPR
jgi:hypothetical protein